MDTMRGMQSRGPCRWSIVTIPCGVDNNDMPFGVQLIGPRHSDLGLVETAYVIENIINSEGFSRVLPLA